MRNHVSRATRPLGLGLAALLTSFAGGSQAQAPAASEAAPKAESPPIAAPATLESRAQEALLSWGCRPEQLLIQQGLVYAACGPFGVWLVRDQPVDGGLTLIERQAVEGEANALFVRNGQVWAQVIERRAAPVAPPAPGTSVATHTVAPVPPFIPVPVVDGAQAGGSPAAPANDEPPVPQGQVISARPFEAMVTLGKNHGLKLRAYVEVDKPASDVEQDVWAESGDNIAVVGQVVSVSGDKARISLGFGESVREGQLARPSRRRATARRMFRPRQARVLELAGGLRPFLPVGRVGGAALIDVDAIYRGERPFFAQLSVAPIGGMIVRGNDAFSFGGFAMVGYDHPYFAVGAGAGVLKWGAVEWDSARRRQDAEHGLGPSLVQKLRLGTRDGLSLTAYNTFVIFNSKSRFGAIDMRGQFPFGDRTWGVAHFAFGEAPGYMLAEAGLKRIVRGNGGPGSVFVTPSLGFAGINPHLRNDDDPVIGPMVSVKVEGRFGFGRD